MLFQFLSLSAALAHIALATKYDQYILAPDSRTLHPTSIHQINGTVDNADSLCSTQPGSATFNGWSSVAYDYDKNIGGRVSFEVASASNTEQFMGLAYSESSLWVSGNWSDATSDAGNDEILWFQITGPGTYTVEPKHTRGGFKYLTLVHNTTGSVEVTSVTTHFDAVPHFAEDQMRNYTGWFNSDDELVNRIWYAGAYTAQLCTINPEYGNSLNYFGIPPDELPVREDGTIAWWSNTTIANASAVLADGGKRDRVVWPGDIVSSWPTQLVTTYDKQTVTDSLDSLFERQNTTTGQLPYAGNPLPLIVSFTYHMHNLIAAAEVYIYSGDIEWIRGKWEQWKFGMNTSISAIDSTGLMNVTAPADWLRFGMGGHNIEANAILYHTLNYGITLATALNDTSVIPTYTGLAASIKSAANALLWDSSAGLYRDNETTTLHPQDGNVWAIVSNLTSSPQRAATISTSLQSRWTPYGAPAPEAGATISPFISGFELYAHALAGNTTALLALTRLQWGFMLDDPRMTNSTFIEGYATNGDLHYAPYANDPRVSHAHGWSTGPTSALTFYVAGLQIVEAGGSRWMVKPRLGDLKRVDAGFANDVGAWEVQGWKDERGDGAVDFRTPEGTVGVVSVEKPATPGRVVLIGEHGERREAELGESGDVEFEDVPGGCWKVRVECD